jgi:hypothetical protein
MTSSMVGVGGAGEQSGGLQFSRQGYPYHASYSVPQPLVGVVVSCPLC